MFLIFSLDNDVVIIQGIGMGEQYAISELPFASFSKRVLVFILSYEHEISFTCKLNSFSYEWLCTRPRFEREALGNSEMVYFTPSFHRFIDSC